jgi:hypothetical protein
MYAKYVYNTSATITQIHDDVFEIFCGETTPGNLSASCDTGNTIIRTTYSTSPWVDFDDVSATERIMRLESSDDTGVFKYVGWHSDGVDNLSFAIMESWTAGTDTPTNEVAHNFTYENIGTLVPASGGTLHIYSSTFCTVVMNESTTNVWGNAGTASNYGSVGIFECTRDHPSLALGDMPNWFRCNTAMFWGDGDTNMDAVFWKMRDETDTVLTPFTAEMTYPGRDNFYSDSNSYPTAGGHEATTALSEIGALITYGLEPIIVTGSFAQTAQDSTTYIGNVSERCDIWMMPVGSEPCGSNVSTADGKSYVVFKAGHTNGTAGDQLGGKFIVPYG